MTRTNDLTITNLGPSRVDSPLLKLHCTGNYCRINFIGDSDKIAFDPALSNILRFQEKKEAVPSLELAGPRTSIFFNPADTCAAIVTCGGLCPGINDVIHGLVMELWNRYGVRKILGIRYGYQGLTSENGHEPLELSPDTIKDIHKYGGSILASSRGEQDARKVVDFLAARKINCLFAIGGDGTMRGALDISEEAGRRHFAVGVVGIPKTIDNDILYIDQSFGFETAFSEAVRSIDSARTEAEGAPNGIGLVKLMGRYSGFIACYAALAVNDVDFVLIPETTFKLGGEHGFLAALREKIKEQRHAVVVVAEGAGQDLMETEEPGVDASENIRLKDIGLFLKKEINSYFKKIKVRVNLKYIDPGYMIRSIPATPQDSVYCMRLAQNAVHAAMSGKTKVVVGKRHGHYVHLPMKLISSGRAQVDPQGDLWLSVLEMTGQGFEMQAPPLAHLGRAQPRRAN